MTEAIRESFEAWAKSQRICVDRDPRGGYVWRSSQTVWEAWQAAISEKPAQGEACEHGTVPAGMTCKVCYSEWNSGRRGPPHPPLASPDPIFKTAQELGL